MYSCCVKSVFYSAFVKKCTDMCKHRFGVQLLQNPPLCSSTVATAVSIPALQQVSIKSIFFLIATKYIAEQFIMPSNGQQCGSKKLLNK